MLPAVPTKTDLEQLSPADLWALEERATEIQDACRELNDERLRHWVEVEGMTQTQVAKLVGRAQSSVSERCKRLGIRAAHNTIPGPRKSIGPDTSASDDAEEVDAEIVEDDDTAVTTPMTSSQPAAAPDPAKERNRRTAAARRGLTDRPSEREAAPASRPCGAP